jgi:hypothetical protein
MAADRDFEVTDQLRLLDLEDEVSEEEPDLGADFLSSKHFEGVTTYTIDWSVESVLGRITNGSIDIAPSYQRRPVWNDEKVWRFFESLLLGLPVPQLVLAARRGARGQFVVLDGKQRLIALQKSADLLSSPERRLPTFEVLGEMAGLRVSDAMADPELSSYRDNFLSQPIRTVVVQGYSDDRVLHTIFHRLNQNSVSLSPQELRRALLPGPFTEWLDAYSANSNGIRRARRLGEPDFRMRDAETVLRFFGLSRRIREYGGDLRAFLDEELRHGNKQWMSLSIDYEELAGQMELAIEANFDIFGKSTYFRWDGERYIGRFNAPLFDVLVGSFRFPDVRAAAMGREAEVRDALNSLSLSQPFQRFITSTTKSKEAVHGRMRLWAEALENRLSLRGLADRMT